MAFNLANFAQLSDHGNDNIPHIWGYRSAGDSLATILAEDYFNTAAAPHNLNEGDTIHVHCRDAISGSLATDAFAAVDTTSTLTVTHVDHGLSEGNKITFAGATLGAGITAAQMNTEHTITSVTNANTYVITTAGTATSTDATIGGASITFTAAEGGQRIAILQVQAVGVDSNGNPSNVAVSVLDGLAQEGGVWVSTFLEEFSTAKSVWAVAPVAGYVNRVHTVLYGAITGGDAAITMELGGTAVTGVAITIANSGSAAGDVDSATATALNIVAAGAAIEVISDGGSTGANVDAMVYIEIVPWVVAA